MPKNIVLLGAPNSGKGTAGRTLAENIDSYFLSVGDFLNDNVVAGTSIGKKAKIFIDAGELVPDDLVLDLVKDKLTNDIACSDGVVFDGYPRTLSQAEDLDKMMSIDAVVFIDVDEDLIYQRAKERRVCPACKNIFSTKRLKGKTKCEVCGTKLITLQDDEEKVLKRRILAYKESTTPLLDYYAEKLIKVDGNKTPGEVDEEIAQKLQVYFGDKR